jgi:hypothetical protein
LNIVPLAPKEPVNKSEQPGYINIHYVDGTSDLLQVDSFGLSDDMPGYITMWSDSLEGPVGFFNNNSIKKITTVINRDKNEDNS